MKQVNHTFTIIPANNSIGLSVRYVRWRRSPCLYLAVICSFLEKKLDRYQTPPLSVPAGRLTGRAETLPVGFWVSGRPSGEISPRLSLPVENMTPPEGFRWDIVCFRWKAVATGMPPEARKTHGSSSAEEIRLPVDLRWNSALPMRFQYLTGTLGVLSGKVFWSLSLIMLSLGTVQ